MIEQFPLLFTLNSPADLRRLDASQLAQVVKELREYIIFTLNQCGGHFAANMGAVELTVALHYIYNTPEDRLVWDVGHQAYPHKILTGRRDLLTTIRHTDGLAPFPSRNESEYDTFTTGHSSTSISAALGMAIANKMHGNSRKTVAIIGDGGMTAGLAFEALNHAGTLHDINLLVILNDNNMSISPNVGGLKNYVARMFSSPFYAHLREGSKKVLQKMPTVWELAKRTESHMKGMIAPPGTLFEELGFNYIGPIDGHDLDTVVKTLHNMHELQGPQFLHVRTIKGKGYEPAENDPVKYHAVSPGFLNAEKVSTSTKPSYSKIFGDWLCDMATIDNDLIAITPAMCEGSGMVDFAKNFPERFHDVGIAEQHSVTLAAGMACEEKKPVVAIYSTFLQRAYDQLIHDVCLQNLDVTFALDRAGIVGGDGATHQGNFDLSYLRCIPNIIVMAPADENESRQMLFTAYQHKGPAAVRFPRGTGPGIEIQKEFTSMPIGKAQIIRQGKTIAILAFGSMVHAAMAAAEKFDATLVNMRFVKPLDEILLIKIAHESAIIFTVEENTKLGGAGSAINEFYVNRGITCPIVNLGLPDQFIDHGNPNEILARYGLDNEGIIRSLNQNLNNIFISKQEEIVA